MKKIAFLGLGVMGYHIASHLLKSNKITIYNRTITKSQKFKKCYKNEQIIIAKNPAEAVKDNEIILSCLGNDKDLKEVYFSNSGIYDSLLPNTYIIDHTTVSSKTAAYCFKKFANKKCFFLDAPVSGGEIGAINGSLSIMVGGKKETYKKSLDILNSLGENVIYAGKLGMGQVFKMCNQIMVGSHIQAMCEAFALCKSKGGNLKLLKETLIGGSANSWMLQNLGNDVIDKNEHAGFRIDLQLKDLKLASEAAFESGVPLPGLSLVLALYLEARAHNEGKNGNQSLFKTYDRMSNQK